MQDDRIIPQFADACPPVHIGFIENARQFYEFLCARWQFTPSEPPYLRDVAAYELAIAQVRAGIQTNEPAPAMDRHPGRDAIRRPPETSLLKCAYNIRPIFDEHLDAVAVVEIPILLAIAIPPGAKHPRVFELVTAAFDLLTALDDWTERSALRPMPELDELICELAEYRLVEVRG
jgi:hypothetical protein